MIRRRLIGVFVLCGLVILPAAHYGSRAGDRTKPDAKHAYVPDTVLVVFNDGAISRARLDALNQLGLTADPQVKSPYFVRARITPAARAAGATVESTVAALRALPAVRYAGPDYLVHTCTFPNDPHFSQQWGLYNTGQTGGKAAADIGAPAAWDSSTGSASVIVAVVDTGVDYHHEDLSANIYRDGGGNVIGYDYANNDSDPADDNGHGTHVSGIIGAVGNNGIGVTGVCWNVRIMPVKFLDASGNGSISNAILAIDFARTHGAKIINASWGSPGNDYGLQLAIGRAKTAGILFVAAAGNYGWDNDQFDFYPASYRNLPDDSNVVAVAATNDTDTLAYFSNFGARKVDIAAPGQDILSTLPGNTYGTLSGTSMAAPQVSGAAALLLSRFPALSLDQLKQRLLGSVTFSPSLRNEVVTGRLNIAGAIENDTTAPGAPTYLMTMHRGERSLRFQWLASGDDGAVGAAHHYDLRYSTAPITAGNFASATPAPGLPVPHAAGECDSYLLTGLAADTDYYVGLQALDNVGNGSALVTAGPFHTSPSSASILFQDDAEGAPQFTGDGTWAITQEDHASGTHCYTDSPGANYTNNLDSSLTQNTPVTLTGAFPVLQFSAKTDLSPYGVGDYCFVEVSANDGATWQRQYTINRGTQPWKSYTVPLTAFSGQSVRVRFRLFTDDNSTANGVWVDDISISTAATRVSVFGDDVEGPALFTGAPPWAVTGESFASASHSYTDSPGGGYANNLDISLTSNGTVDLPGLAPVLTFHARTALEYRFDYLFLEVSPDGGTTWQRLRNWTDHNDFPWLVSPTWSTYEVSLNEYAGQSIKVRFRLVTDSSNGDDGVWIDDVRISGEQLSALHPPLASLTVAPASVIGGKTATGKVTLSSAAPATGTLVDLRSANPSAASVPDCVAVPPGATSATFTITTYPIAANTVVGITASRETVKSAALTVQAPSVMSVSLTPSTVVGSLNVAGKVTLNGKTAAITTVSLGTTNPAATAPATVSVPANATSQSFTITTIAVSSSQNGAVNATLNGVTKSANLTVRPIGVKSLGLTPPSLVGGGGRKSTGKVTLEAAAAPGDIDVLLETNDTATARPAVTTIKILAGQSTGTFQINTDYVSVSHTVILKSTANGIAKTSNLTVRPIGVKSLSLSPSSLIGGSGHTSTATVTLDSLAGPSDISVALESSDPAAANPAVANINIPAGKTNGTFLINTGAVASPHTAIIKATVNGIVKTANLTVNPP